MMVAPRSRVGRTSLAYGRIRLPVRNKDKGQKSSHPRNRGESNPESPNIRGISGMERIMSGLTPVVHAFK